jgi:hypothetical protein
MPEEVGVCDAAQADQGPDMRTAQQRRARFPPVTQEARCGCPGCTGPVRVSLSHTGHTGHTARGSRPRVVPGTRWMCRAPRPARLMCAGLTPAGSRPSPYRTRRHHSGASAVPRQNRQPAAAWGHDPGRTRHQAPEGTPRRFRCDGMAAESHPAENRPSRTGGPHGQVIAVEITQLFSPSRGRRDRPTPFRAA